MSPYRARAAAGAAIILGLQAMAVPALAHHGWGSYDSTTVTTLEGTVQSVSFNNPHASVQLESQGKVWTSCWRRRRACRAGDCRTAP